jgi:hypothetical protein
VAQAAGPTAVTADDLVNAQANAGDWLTYGRDYQNRRFSPLAAVDRGNVAGLKPVFAYSTGGKFAGLEATPLFRDGTLYFTGDYSRVFALDARTGTLKWYWEPTYEDGIEAVLCCGPVNRGLAMLGDKLFVGTLDARLVALNAADGTIAWERQLEDWKKAYSSTGAPLAVGDLVITGIAGPSSACAASCRRSRPRPASRSGRPTASPAPASPATTLGPAKPGEPAAPRPGRRAPTTPRPARSSGASGTPARGTRTCARATTSGAARSRRQDGQDQVGVPVHP